MTLLAVSTVALVLLALLGLALMGGRRNGPPLVALIALLTAVAVLGASWTLPVVVVDHPGPLDAIWGSLQATQDTPSPLARWVYDLTEMTGTSGARLLPRANALFGLGLAILGLVLLARQVSHAALGLIVLLAVATACAPVVPDTLLSPLAMDWRQPVDRWAIALAIPVIVSLATPGPARTAFEALVLGFGLAGLVLLHLTLAVGVLALLILACLLRTISLWHGVLSVTALCAILAGVDVLDQPLLPYLSGFAWPAFDGDAATPAMGLGVGAATLMYLAMIGACHLGPDIRAPLFVIAIAGLDAIWRREAGWPVVGPLLGLLPVISAEWTPILRSTEDKMPAPLWAGLAGLTVAAALLIPIRDVSATLAQHLLAARISPNPALAETPVTDLVWTARTLPPVDIIEAYDALDTLGAGLSQTGAVAVIGGPNPFPLMLGKPPSDNAADVDFVAVRKGATPPEAEQNRLNDHFKPVTDLDHWVIWAR